MTLLLNAVIWIVMMVGEVNSFFFINIVNLPRDHSFNVARQVLLCLAAVPAVEEWYEYTRHSRMEYTVKYDTISDQEWNEYKKLYEGRKPRIGHFTWLVTLTIVLETLTLARYGRELNRIKWRTPQVEIWGPWAAFSLLFSLYFVIHCWMFYRRERLYPIWLRVLKWTAFLPLLALLRLYAF